MEICKKFCERIPGMSEISAGDRETLYQAASLELVILRMAYRQVLDFSVKNHLMHNNSLSQEQTRFGEFCLLQFDSVASLPMSSNVRRMAGWHT